MTFTAAQTGYLNAPLSRDNVSKRQGAGSKQLSYIESHHAIREANRIFGFDGWSSETVDLRCIVEKPGECSYLARVRVTVYAGDRTLIREGVGAGHGKDHNIGQAHEKASKEAESDAQKRALRHFGDQFGLALYDKYQEHVADDAPEPRPAAPAHVDAALIDRRGTAPPPAKEATGALSLPQRGGNKELAGSKPHHPADAKPHSRTTHNDLTSKLAVHSAGLMRNRKTLPIAKENLAKWEKYAKSVWANMNKFDAERVAKEREKFLALIAEVEGANDKVKVSAAKGEDIDQETGELKEAAA